MRNTRRNRARPARHCNPKFEHWWQLFLYSFPGHASSSRDSTSTVLAASSVHDFEFGASDGTWRENTNVCGGAGSRCIRSHSVGVQASNQRITETANIPQTELWVAYLQTTVGWFEGLTGTEGERRRELSSSSYTQVTEKQRSDWELPNMTVAPSSRDTMYRTIGTKPGVPSNDYTICNRYCCQPQPRDGQEHQPSKIKKNQSGANRDLASQGMARYDPHQTRPLPPPPEIRLRSYHVFQNKFTKIILFFRAR